ncbi:hypothetical protein P389DRAFT_188289 [Cystobasidium minutum MCA 4210]|uniref:uncharacterized protein n=1 Tax=Cystobasidium minutum MCA 4210 TaxID=1397322 RepID=UPI0034CF6800|eukprot:jgi/Rhomi1/188289/estExt_fgenesh1_pg.C_2_t20118
MTAIESLLEKSHLDEDDVPPTEDVPDYDDLLESALDALDVYQARRADMNLHLKKAFFNLAQAKLALGPARVGPASYHHGRVEPLLTVDISSSPSGTFSYTLVEGKPAVKPEAQTSVKGKERASSSRVDLRYSGSTSAIKLDDPSNEKNESGKVRRRVQKMFKKDKKAADVSEKEGADTLNQDDASSYDDSDTKEGTTDGRESTDDKTDSLQSDDAPPTYTETVNEYLLDPMQQFSAFPPVTLRKAQLEFRQSLSLATTLLSEQQKFGGISSAASDYTKKA